MRYRIVPALVMAIVLGACAAPSNPAYDAFQSYISTNKPRAEYGYMKWSEYYGGLHFHASAAGAPGYVLANYNEAIKISHDLEAGRIDKNEHGYRLRALQADGRSKQEAASAQARDEDMRRQQLGTAQMLAGVQMMQASQPQAYQPPVATPAQPHGNAYVTGYLRTQTQNGTLRLCNYTNGAVITVASHQICPNSTN